MLSGHYGFVLVYWHGLKDFEDRQGGPVRSRATISADFERKVPFFPVFALTPRINFPIICFRLDASDQFSYHLIYCFKGSPSFPPPGHNDFGCFMEFPEHASPVKQVESSNFLYFILFTVIVSQAD